jgi:hypothetical protein
MHAWHKDKKVILFEAKLGPAQAAHVYHQHALWMLHRIQCPSATSITMDVSGGMNGCRSVIVVWDGMKDASLPAWSPSCQVGNQGLQGWNGSHDGSAQTGARC